MFTYIQRNEETFSVGSFDPAGEFTIETEWKTAAAAAGRVSYLNGGLHPHLVAKLENLLDQVIVKVDFMNCTRSKASH